jgi:pimeloyl-ACP methyl ester carboxylesterase
MRSRTLVMLVLALGAVALSAPAQAAAGKRLRLGSVVLHHCGGGLSGWCGSIPRALDPARPRGPHVRIGFRWLPASGRDEGAPAIVPVEGGPGYPSIGSTSEYEGTYGALLRTRNLLLVDNRGTGASALIDCKALQTFTGVTSSPAFPGLVADCARKIDRRYRSTRGRSVHATDLFATAFAAADMSAVLRALRLGKVDLYGDSYGTWFVQSFISRHRDQLHSVILDSAYPVRGLDPWYASSGGAARSAMDAVCARDLSCSATAPGSATARLAQLVAVVRDAPFEGDTRDSDDSSVHARVDVRALVDLVQDAGSDPVIYRELDASVRAALAGDRVPLLRLVAQSQTWSHGTNPATYFSDGLYFAVACTDYPQLFDMSAAPGERRSQFAASASMAPDAFAPFTPAEWLKMSAYSESYQSCLDWPRPVRRVPAVPATAGPLPASIPILVIGGDLDSLTPLSDAKVLATALGRKVRVITLPNTVHVTSEDDTYLFSGADCARRIIREFVRAPARLASLDARCAGEIPPVHTPGVYPASFADVPPATVLSGPDPGEDARRAVGVAAGALADASMRWYYSSARRGPGLRGGSFTTAPDGDNVRFRLSGVRFAADATVDGTGSWQLGAGRYHGDLVVSRPGADPVAVSVDWDQGRSTGLATVGGSALVLPAP